MNVVEKVKCVKANAALINFRSTSEKNDMLKIVATCLRDSAVRKLILNENSKDIENCRQTRAEHFIDRLRLNEKRLDDMADGVDQLIGIDDPVGEILSSYRTEEGLKISKVSVPFGVMGIIYEARPNVTADAIALALKSGNAVVLRGSKEALLTNRAIVSSIKSALVQGGYSGDMIALIEDITHEGVFEMMKLKSDIDVLIPRGGAALIQNVVENSLIPVIETGTGNCHIYVHEKADFDMAIRILINAKISRPSVCNAAESLLVDRSIASRFLPLAKKALDEHKVKVLGCSETVKITSCEAATKEDFYTEFLDYVISVKVVDGIDAAICHINEHGTKHSECIVTADSAAAQRFKTCVDAACVYHNASTRFTDGYMFGFGAEIGISTQKLHARGPMGLKELTTYKYEIEGEGQIRT